MGWAVTLLLFMAFILWACEKNVKDEKTPKEPNPYALDRMKDGLPPEIDE